MIQRSSIDPGKLVARKISVLTNILCPPVAIVDEVSELVCSTPYELIVYVYQNPAAKTARHRAITTVAFLHPETALPQFFDCLSAYLDVKSANALTQEQIGIWETPEGTLFTNGKTEFSLLRLTPDIL